MQPWVFVLALVIFLFVLVMAYQGVRDLVIWYREGRDFARERKRLKEQRLQKKTAKQQMPVLKERPSDPKPGKEGKAK